MLTNRGDINEGNLKGRRYRIIKRLGQGGFGETYLVKDIRCNRICVLKRLCSQPDPQLLQKAQELFEREAQCLQNLGDKHPQIPTLFDYFYEESDRRFYLIQEYIEGDDLSQEIISGKQLSEEEVTKLLENTLEILEYIHSKDVIHRDLKPSNLIRRKFDSKICLIDFGAVAVREIALCTPNNTGEIGTTLIGTPDYAPPEQFKGRVTYSSDIYALGIVAIQALTGLNPSNFERELNDGEIRWHHRVKVSRKFKKIIDKMVRWHVRDRYKSAEEVLKALRQSKTYPKIGWLKLAIASILLVISINYLASFIPHSETCPIKTNDSLSCGEEILIQNSLPRFKTKGVNFFEKRNYKKAVEEFKKSWQTETKDPETLIYLNNALLEAKKAKYYTIAVVAPITPDEHTAIRNADLAQELLRGVAQAQTEVNLGIFNDRFFGKDFQKRQTINGKGIRVLIADDANMVDKAKQIAEALVKQPDILAVVGHYASEMTLATVDIYNKNKLVLISPGSTTEKLTQEPREYFFRTVPSAGVMAEYLANYLINAQKTKAAAFYNPDSSYAQSIWSEFQQRFTDKKGKILEVEDYNLSDSNFDADRAIASLSQKEIAIVLFPDGQVTNSFENAIELLTKNNGRHLILGGWGLYSPRTLNLANRRSFNQFGVSVPWHRLNSPNPEFPQEAEKLWKGVVSPLTALAYDATQASIEAFSLQNTPTRTNTKKTLAKADFSTQGATGTIKFDSRGDRLYPSVDLVHVVQCGNRLEFIPTEYPTAEAAGLTCN